MKFFALALTLLTLVPTMGHAASPSLRTGTFSTLAVSFTHREALSRMMTAPTTSSFAQLATIGHAPVSSSLLLTLVVVFVVALRLMGLQHARAMADRERSLYHGKSEMFRSLHDEQAGSRNVR